MSGTPAWPEAPRPGTMVRSPLPLPLPLPPMLIEAVGYDGSARYVALWWTPLGDELMWSDGTTTATGGFHAWLCLTGHAGGRVILGRYRLGDSETEGEELLLADRWQGTRQPQARRQAVPGHAPKRTRGPGQRLERRGARGSAHPGASGR